MPLPIIAAIAGIAASSAAVITCAATVARTISSYNLDPRVAAKKQMKDLAYMQKCQEEMKENQTLYDAGERTEKNYLYYDGLYRRQIAWMHERMQERAGRYQPVQVPPDPNVQV